MIRLRHHYNILIGIGLLIITGVIAGMLSDGWLQKTHSGYEITWLGDTLLGDASEPFLLRNGYEWAFEYIAIPKADLTVVNLEGPITALAEHWFEQQKWSYNALPPAAAALADIGIDLASLGNNHSLDRGPAGLTDTIKALGATGISTIGAGLNARDAAKPFIVDTPYGRVGIFSFTEESSTAPNAGENAGENAGIYALDTRNIIAAQQIAETDKVDWLVAFVHWGTNYSDISSTQRQWAKRLANLGFNLVVGTGPHNFQPVEIIGRTPVVYSIGNFVFGTPGRWTGEYPGIGLIVTTVLGRTGFRELRIECLQTDNTIVQYQPRYDPTVASRVFESMSPNIQLKGNVGVLKW